MNKTTICILSALALCGAAQAAESRCDYDNYTKRWPQLKGVTLTRTNSAALEEARKSGATLVRYAVTNGMPKAALVDFVKRVEGKGLYVALGCGTRAREIAQALKGRKAAVYAYVLDSAADVGAVRAADPETPVAVPYGEAQKTLSLSNVFYTVGVATNETDAARRLQLATGARIYVPAFGEPADKQADIFLKYGWDWTYAGASITNSPAAKGLEKRLNDRRLTGYVAGTIRYPERLSSKKRFRGTGIGYWGDEVPKIEAAAAMGANLVRIGFYSCWGWKRTGAFTDARLAEGEAAVDRRLKEIERDLDCVRRLGIKAVVTGPSFDNGYLVEAECAAAVIRSWRKIARKLKGRSEVYGYDIVNEPTDLEKPPTRIRHRDFMILVATAIREEDPDVTLVVEMNCSTSPSGFDSPSPFGLETGTPIPFDNVVYSPHVYQPMAFSHQGLHKKADAYAHVDYPGGTFIENGVKKANKDYILGRLRGIREFQQKYGARIWVGEFSCAAWTKGGAAYLQDLVDIFEEYGWDYTYHSFRENSIWSLEHEGKDSFSLRPAADDTDRMKVLKAAWAKNGEAEK